MSAEFAGVEHAFGRVEAKLDAIDVKIDRHAELIAAHGVRLDRVEDDVRSIVAGFGADHGHRRTGRQLLWVGIASAATTGVATWLVTFLTSHH